MLNTHTSPVSSESTSSKSSVLPSLAGGTLTVNAACAPTPDRVGPDVEGTFVAVLENNNVTFIYP